MAIPILKTWKQYFKDHNEGLGTTYERFILHQYFERIKNIYSIRSILEVPSFGMTGVSGINSMWWASQGAKVTVVDQDKERINLIKEVWQKASLKAEFIYQTNNYESLPFENNSFDMSWNFASLWFVSNLEKFLNELIRVTNKIVFICIPNRRGLGYLTRMALNKNANKELYLDNIVPGKIINIMQRRQWQMVDYGYLDVPPWPDIAMKKEDLLKKIGFNWLSSGLNDKEKNGLCILDYFSGKNKDMGKKILRYSFLEHSPGIFKKFWAHHRYIIFASE